MTTNTQTDIIRQLQKQVLSMQGMRAVPVEQQRVVGLGAIEHAFPEQQFPLGALHELISKNPEQAAATNSFVAGILGRLMLQGGACIWVGINRTVFAPALKAFGIEPEQIIFIDLTTQKQALWVIEEALKCAPLCAVVGELRGLSFTESRRLQLAIEASHVTGFLHRCNPKSENIIACMARWKINPLASVNENGLPGIGFPRWNVELVKARNGKPGKWQIEWNGEDFRHIAVEHRSVNSEHAIVKTG